MDMSDTSRPSIDEVDLMLANARLRDELEPFRDESIDDPSTTRMPLHTENEYLASMLAWERAPALPISRWFSPELELAPPESLADDELGASIWRRQLTFCFLSKSCCVVPITSVTANFTRSSTATSCPAVKRRSRSPGSFSNGAASRTPRLGYATTPLPSSVVDSKRSTTSTCQIPSNQSTKGGCRVSNSALVSVAQPLRRLALGNEPAERFGDYPFRYFHIQPTAATASRHPIFLPSS